MRLPATHYTMRTMFLLLMICATCVQAQVKLSAVEKNAVREFMTSRMPSFKCEAVTLQEAVAVMRKEWTTQHPGEMFPVTISGDPELMTKDGLQRLTFDLKNIPFYGALKILAGDWLCEIDCGNSAGRLFMLRHWDVDDMIVELFPLTPGLLSALKVKRDASEEQVKDAFTRAGIHWEKWMSAQFSKDRLIVKASPDVVENIGCIDLMIDAGMKIEGTKF
ncbi:MAG: hypothetical protein WCD79_07205 [Chthoniobacteraceae bacterium]